MSSTAGTGPWTRDKQFHESPEEMDKIRRRSAIRQKLKSEFNRLHYNPYKIASHVEILDPAVQRFMSMRATHFQHWQPTWGSFAMFFSIAIMPIWGFGYFLNYQHREFDRKCRTGEIPVEKRGVLLV